MENDVEIKKLSIKEKIVMGFLSMFFMFLIMVFFFYFMFNTLEWSSGLIILKKFNFVFIIPIIIAFLIPFSTSNKKIKDLINVIAICGMLLLLYSVTTIFQKVKVERNVSYDVIEIKR